MRPTQFSADTIIALLRNQTIASLAEVMAALGARASRRTAFRKLKDMDARTSYSHRGGYYTLDQLAHFDERGLWTFAGVRFSRAGTLLATAESLIPRWTGQIRPLVDTAKPAISGVPRRHVSSTSWARVRARI